jgi:4-hydroxybenzoate polyprenyltransferase
MTVPTHAGAAPRLVTRAVFEARLTWRYTCYDIPSASAAPILTIAVWHFLHLPGRDLPTELAKSLIFIWLFLLVHTTANQAISPAEDHLNVSVKPLRPIASGLTTVTSTHRRFLIYSLAYIWIGLWWNVAGWTLLWVTFSALYNYAGWSRNWITKSAYPALACIAGCLPLWAMLQPLNSTAWRWIGLFALYWAVNFIQDLRDVRGDRAVGRRTLPMLIGDQACRWILAAVFSAFTLVVHLFLIVPAGTPGPAAMLWEAIFALGGWWIAWRLITRRTPHADHITYLAYCWQASWLLAGLFFL